MIKPTYKIYPLRRRIRPCLGAVAPRAPKIPCYALCARYEKTQEHRRQRLGDEKLA